MLYEAYRVSWGVVWKMKPSEYEPEPAVRIYIRDLADRQAARRCLDECRGNPRCAAAAVVRFTEVCDIEEAFFGREDITKGY